MLPTITIDVGTTSVKLCRFDGRGVLLASQRLTTPTRRDDAGEIYDVDALRAGIVEFIRELDDDARSSVRRIAITGVGESGGLVRGDLTLASPMILWHDQRGAARLAQLDASARARLYRITGVPANGNYALSKVAWAVDRVADAGDAQWLNIAEYLAATMTGQRWAEPSLASRTMALDLSTRTWSREAAALLGVDVSVFPVIRSAAQGAHVTASFADEAGLGRDVDVHVAGHDHMVGAAGAGLEAGELLNSTGTTEGLLFRTEAPRLDDDAERAKLANGLDCTGRGYTLFASIPTGGSAFATLQRMLGMHASRLEAVLERLHADYIAGAVDLSRTPVVLPRFRGSPPPDKLAAARGGIAGIGDGTTAEEIVFGTFLGMAVQFREVLGLFGLAPSVIKVIGPASRNPLWLQLKADLLGVPLQASARSEVVSRGAQALAGGTAIPWSEHEVIEVATDSARHTALREWSDSARAQWEHLKAVPA
ncbi:FGGY-family carbohydrate kinase [Microbacterium sp. XT11]|uniref:FGGY-family carbohydrate kinase n=1 Tax=Microbacterium sp. XT11 TaxID=367477 RepID=UPI000832927A|nr:FGGY family carbohydrate kinase [Microbacterium sp. XT11]